MLPWDDSALFVLTDLIYIVLLWPLYVLDDYVKRTYERQTYFTVLKPSFVFFTLLLPWVCNVPYPMSLGLLRLEWFIRGVAFALSQITEQNTLRIRGALTQ